MGFICGCDDSDYGIVDEYILPWNGHKTIRCKECRCELAPGHIVHTTIMGYLGEIPFDDMTEEEIHEALNHNNTEYIHMCEKCSDLSEAVSNAGMCWYFGELWSSYAEWLDMRGLSPRSKPGRWKND